MADDIEDWPTWKLLQHTDWIDCREELDARRGGPVIDDEGEGLW